MPEVIVDPASLLDGLLLRRPPPVWGQRPRLPRDETTAEYVERRLRSLSRCRAGRVITFQFWEVEEFLQRNNADLDCIDVALPPTIYETAIAARCFHGSATRWELSPSDAVALCYDLDIMRAGYVEQPERQPVCVRAPIDLTAADVYAMEFGTPPPNLRYVARERYLTGN